MSSDVSDVTEVAAGLRLSITRLARQLRQQTDVGLTPTQLTALAVIERHGPLGPGALAEYERVSAPTMTRVVNRLTEAGLVERTSDPTDRRAALLVVTGAGRALLRRARTRKDIWLTERLAELPPEHLRRLADAADALDALVELGRRADGAPG